MDQQKLICISIHDAQSVLSNSLKTKNVSQFLEAINTYNANPETVDSETFISVFDKCCQMPGHEEFIKACIKCGCDVNKLNKNFNKRPINFAVESADPDNIAALVDIASAKVDINAMYEDLTPIHHLAGKLNKENFSKIFQCIKILVDKNANVNIPNRRSQTPILTIAKNQSIDVNQKLEVCQYFLNNLYVDLDSFRNGEARTVLGRQFESLVLPEKSETIDSIDFFKLFDILENENEIQFLYAFDQYVKQCADIEKDSTDVFRDKYRNDTLLIAACRRGSVRIVDKLLRSGADVNNYKEIGSAGKKTEWEQTKSPVAFACIYGNWQVLDLLLKCSDICVSDTPLLVDTVKNATDRDPNVSRNFQKCFDLLLNYHKIDINQQDMYGNTALHSAVKYKNEAAITNLLEKGTYIGVRNKFNEFAIGDINPDILEKHFDHCVTSNNRRPGDADYEIIFEYDNLVPLRKPKDNKVAVLKKSADEMVPIAFMAKSSELKHLVKHPLIASFLFLKWYRLAKWFYLNFAMYSVYCLALILYLLFCYGVHEVNRSDAFAIILRIIIAIGLVYIFLREIVQLIMSPKVYIRSYENILELLLIVMTIVVLLGNAIDNTSKRTIAAFTILIAVGEFFLLTGSLPILSFSTHLVMLKTVSKSFLKSLLLYSIILIAFALCFYTLLGADDAQSQSVQTMPNQTATIISSVEDKTIDGTSSDSPKENDDDNFNNFEYPGVSLLKTVVMLTGEFDASSINFKNNPSSYIIFVMFVFLISTVLFNLLNGLAVSDTQAIKNEAELMNFIHRTEIIARYERIIIGNGDTDCCNFMMRKWSSNFMSLFPSFLPLNTLKVYPNENNALKIPMPQILNKNPIENEMEVESTFVSSSDEKRTFYQDIEYASKSRGCIGGHCGRMEPKIVKYARQVLEKKKFNLERIEEKERVNERIEKIEKSVEQILEKINFIAEKLSES